jgi:hypothetical protein
MTNLSAVTWPSQIEGIMARQRDILGNPAFFDAYEKSTMEKFGRTKAALLRHGVDLKDFEILKLATWDEPPEHLRQYASLCA